jgi:hypothetical protein
MTTTPVTKVSVSCETSVHSYQTTRRPVPENTNLYSDSRGIGKPLRLFVSCLSFFYFLFSYFFLFFISYVFFLLIRILPCFLHCLFISFFPCILVSSLHVPLFSPRPLLFICLLRLLFTYTHVLSCVLISYKQLSANDRFCLCVSWHFVCPARHLCHCCCER